MCMIKICQKGHNSLNTAQQQILLEELTSLLVPTVGHGQKKSWTYHFASSVSGDTVLVRFTISSNTDDMFYVDNHRIAE